MPLVNIKLIEQDQLSAATKAELIEAVTTAVADTLNKPKSITWVVIEEISSDNWGIGGETLTQKRATKPS